MLRGVRNCPKAAEVLCRLPSFDELLFLALLCDPVAVGSLDFLTADDGCDDGAFKPLEDDLWGKTVFFTVPIDLLVPRFIMKIFEMNYLEIQVAVKKCRNF